MHLSFCSAPVYRRATSSAACTLFLKSYVPHGILYSVVHAARWTGRKARPQRRTKRVRCVRWVDWPLAPPTLGPVIATPNLPTKIISTKIRWLKGNMGNSLWTWEFHPLKLRFCLSQTLWNPESLVPRLAVHPDVTRTGRGAIPRRRTKRVWAEKVSTAALAAWVLAASPSVRLLNTR